MTEIAKKSEKYISLEASLTMKSVLTKHFHGYQDMSYKAHMLQLVQFVS